MLKAFNIGGLLLGAALSVTTVSAAPFSFTGNVKGRCYQRTLDGVTGNVTGTLSIPSFMLMDAQLALITPSTPGNETGTTTTTRYRANDGTDIGDGGVAFPVNEDGLIFQVGTNVPAFGAFPIFAIAQNADGSFFTLFTGVVNGTTYYDYEGSAVRTTAVATPGPIAGPGIPAILALWALCSCVGVEARLLAPDIG